MVVFDRSSSGSAREASNSNGESGWPGVEAAYLTRLEGEEVVEVEDDVRFLETRLAADRICFATFSSGKMDCIFGNGVLDRLSGLSMPVSIGL